MIKYLPLILLTACAIAPERYSELTPAECRAHGVDVRDDDPVKGEVVQATLVTYGGILRECGGGGVVRYQACAKGVSDQWPDPDHRYEAWATNMCDLKHEVCHARYERSMHTHGFNLAYMQGNTYASCGTKWDWGF